MGRKFYVGGNWKLNGTKQSIQVICDRLKTSQLDSETEVLPSLQCRRTKNNYYM